MTETQLLKYCYFYNGASLPPVEYSENESALWTAEKYVCEHLGGKIDTNNPALSVAEYVSAYVGKWAPFNHDEIMSVYVKRCPEELKSKLL